MVTNKEAIYQLKTLSEKNQLSTDNNWSDIWIYNELLKYRARLITQRKLQNIPISEFNYQEIVINLIEVPPSECIIDVDSECIIYRSQYIIPKSIVPLRVANNPVNNKQYNIIEKSKLKFILNTRISSLNKKTIGYSLDSGKGDHLYFISTNPLLSKVTIKTVFYNPVEAQTYPDCDGNILFPCRSFYDYEFKVDDSIRTTSNEMILNYAYKAQFGPDDRINDNVIHT